MKLLVIVLLFPTFFFSQVRSTYPFGETKIVFDTINKMIDGNFKHFYPNGKVKARGQFSKNQKIGVWKFYTSNGKLLFKRNYQHNFLFKSEENIPTLNINGFNYGHINDYDILYQDIFLTLISHNPANESFFKDNLLLNEIKKYFLSENPMIYNDENFSKLISIKDANSSLKNTGKINHFVFKETVFYDKKHQIINRRVIAIMPVKIINKTIAPLFSIYEPQLRGFTQNKLILDKLFNNQYYGEVVKILSANKNPISQYSTTKPPFTNESISWFVIEKEFELEAFYLEKEINNNFRMKFEPELYINLNDSLNISKLKKQKLKYKFQEQ